MVAVVAESEVSLARHGVVLLGRSEDGKSATARARVGVALVAVFGGHDAEKNRQVGDLAVDVEFGRRDAQGLSAEAGEAFDVVLRPHARSDAGFDATDAGGAEDEDIAELRADEIVGDLVDEKLVAGVGMAADDGLSGGKGASGIDLEVAPNDVHRRRHAVSARAGDDFRGGEEMEAVHFAQSDHRVVLLRGDIDVGASAQDEFRGADQRVGGRIDGRRASHAVERRLHGTGGDFEGLEKIGADAEGDDERDEHDLGVFAQSGQRRTRGGLVEEFVQLGGGLFDAVAFLFPQRDLQLGDPFVEGNDLFFRQDIAPVAQQLAGGPQHELGLFAVTGREEQHGLRKSAESRACPGKRQCRASQDGWAGACGCC